MSEEINTKGKGARFTNFFKNEHPVLKFILEICTFIIAIIAIFLAMKSIDQADIQFKTNSEQSDSLFNIQLMNAKRLNDSLISQIKTLQDVSNNQMKITDEQLKVSRAIYHSQLYADRPQISIQSNEISDTNYVIDGLFSPKIITTYMNVGRRMARNLHFRPFIIYPDFVGYRPDMKKSIKENLDPTSGITSDFISHIPVKYKEDFYYCFDISYYDDILDQYFHNTYYYSYHRIRTKLDFYTCTVEIQLKLKSFIDINIIKDSKTSLFGE